MEMLGLNRQQLEQLRNGYNDRYYIKAGCVRIKIKPFLVKGKEVTIYQLGQRE